MITGVYRDGHPRVTLTVFGDSDHLDAEFIVDTGFAGDLTLPRAIASPLDLSFMARQIRRLANGDEREYEVFIGTVEWMDDNDREVQVTIMEGDLLFGTGLLEGMLLQVEGCENGTVCVEPLD